MPSWNELLSQLDNVQQDWWNNKLNQSLSAVGKLRGNRNVLFYASGFLQKPTAHPQLLQITHEDINGFMSVMYGMDWSHGLTLLLHTPGGIGNAVETIVDYLWQKFPDFEVIVPVFAMSAGTMMSLASTKIIMGRQSQLGPIDPQLPIGGRFVSAQSVVDQFTRARREILRNSAMATVWFPIQQSIGSAGLQEARNAIAYAKKMVAQWLQAHMFADHEDPEGSAERTVKFFSDVSRHRSHGRRINRAEAREQNVVIYDLEDDQTLQDEVLTAYHLITLVFEKTPAAKVIVSHEGRRWIKNTQISP
jgi:hypothetical protein